MVGATERVPLQRRWQYKHPLQPSGESKAHYEKILDTSSMACDW